MDNEGQFYAQPNPGSDCKRLSRFVPGPLPIYPYIEIVGTVSDAVEAIAHWQQLNPDVVLVELAIPELNGVSPIQEIHHHRPHIRFHCGHDS